MPKLGLPIVFCVTKLARLHCDLEIPRRIIPDDLSELIPRINEIVRFVLCRQLLTDTVYYKYQVCAWHV